MTIPRTVDDLTPEWCSDALGRTITTVAPDAARCRGRARRPALPARARRARRRVDRRRRSSRRRPTRAASSRPCSTCTAARSASTASSRPRTTCRHPSVIFARARPRDAGHRAAARRRVGARSAARSGRGLLAGRGAPGDPHAGEAARVLLGRSHRSTTRRFAAAALRRSVSRARSRSPTTPRGRGCRSSSPS